MRQVMQLDDALAGHSCLSFNRFLRSVFKERVQKISLDAGLGCPNRDGTKGTGGCIYCDSRGSGTGAAARGINVREQMRQGLIRAKKRYRANRFLPYFQSFSNTYGSLPVLEKLYRDAMDFPGVAGIAIGTRPDCVSPEILDLVDKIVHGRMVWMEYGLQSADNRTLDRINRGHTVEDFVHAVEITQDAGFLICAHVIFGLPGQDVNEIRNTIELIASLKVKGIKFHNLYVMKGTPLHHMYEREPFPLMKQEEYASLVADAIKYLPPDTVIQRLTGDPPWRMPDTMPAWSHDKQGTIKLILERLADDN